MHWITKFIVTSLALGSGGEVGPWIILHLKILIRIKFCTMVVHYIQFCRRRKALIPTTNSH